MGLSDPAPPLSQLAPFCPDMSVGTRWDAVSVKRIFPDQDTFSGFFGLGVELARG